MSMIAPRAAKPRGDVWIGRGRRSRPRPNVGRATSNIFVWCNYDPFKMFISCWKSLVNCMTLSP